MYKFALYSFYKNIGRYLIKETVKQSYLVVLKKTATTNNWVFISFSIISCLCWLSTRDTRIKGDISFVNENHLKCFSFLKSVCQNYKKNNFFCFKVFIFICSTYSTKEKGVQILFLTNSSIHSFTNLWNKDQYCA